MRPSRTAVAVAAMLGISLGAASWARSSETEGTKQCYRRVYEAPTACSACAETCLGEGYRCCEIVPG